MAASLHLGLLVLGTVSLLGRCEVKLNAGCKIETLRACRDDYVPYKKGPHLHESGQEFDEGCKKDKTQIPCTLKFINECTDGLPKATALVAIKALEENIEAICNIGSDPYENYQKGIKCMNSQGGKLHKCIKDFVSIMERAIVKAPAKDVVHYTCCSYYDAVECLSKSLTPCESVGSKDFMIRVVEEMFGETLNLVCGRYTKGSENCKSLPQLPRLGAKDRRVNNIVEILLEAAGTLGRKH